MKTRQIVLILLLFLAVLLAACAPGTSETPETETDSFPLLPITTTPTDLDTPESQEGLCEDPFGSTLPAFSTSGWDTDFCIHSVPYNEILSGGPPRDGIPPLDNPRFEDVGSADEWIEDLEPVILVEYEGEARAYPLQIMTWHEIVNDEISGNPIAVTFCPLCNTALVFRRPTIDGEILTFGTSGNLRNFKQLCEFFRLGPLSSTRTP